MEQSLAKKKEQSRLSQEMKGESPKARVNVREGVRVFAVFFLGIQKDGRRGMRQTVEAAMKQGRTTRHPELVVCDQNILKHSLWFKDSCMSIEVPGESMSTFRSKVPSGERIERTYDYVIASQSLQGKIKNMEW